MNKNNYLSTYKIHYTYIALILCTLLFWGCKDSLNSLSGASGEINTNNTPDSTTSGALSLEISQTTGDEFKVFDATGFIGKPNMSRFGIRPIGRIYTNDLYSTPRNEDNKWDFVAESKAALEAHQAANMNGRTIMVDVQNWPTSSDDDEVVQESTQRYSALYYDLKQAEPNMNFGYFGTLPIKNYWPNDPTQERLNIWRNKNDRLKKLGGKVDVFFLPGYTRSKDRNRWVTNMKYLIEEARRIGDDQPVYVVLWPQYNAKNNESLDRQYIEGDFWKLQLETAKKYADGVVLYAPHGTQWNGPSPWFNETKRFMADLGEYSHTPKISDSEFEVFDGTRFRDKPDMSKLGFTPIKVIYEMMLWDKPMDEVGIWEHPKEWLVEEWAHKASEVNSNISMINIEHWPTKGEDVEMGINKYSLVHDWFKEAESNMNFGYYSTVPYRVHWNRYPTTDMLSSITEINDKLAPLANKVDAFFLCAYAKKMDREEWIMNTKYMVKMAHKYGGDKPVYLTLWPQYHNQNDPWYNGNYISKEFWELQLKIARKYADGVLIWFPYDTKWSEASNAPWWDATKSFLQDLGKTQ